jgi:uncharacterized membrane protein YbaN (DUF454 family)
MKPPFDNSTDEGKELIRMWQESTLPGPFDPSKLAREISGQVRTFDRRIFWRNFREYAAGFLFMGFMLLNVVHPERRLIGFSGIAAVAFVMIYMWRSHRSTPQLDTTADARSYQAALLARYDRQIRLLRNVKYWYVLPLYAWMVLTVFLTRAPGARMTYLAVMTAFAAFIVWLNEGYAVRKLREQRKKTESMLQFSESRETGPASGNPPQAPESQ